jgi:hypothetical protein
VLVPLLVPLHGGDPKIKGIIDAISKIPGKGKVMAILQLWPVIIAALSLLCWLPAPSSGASKILRGCSSCRCRWLCALLVAGTSGRVRPVNEGCSAVGSGARGSAHRLRRATVLARTREAEPRRRRQHRPGG